MQTYLTCRRLLFSLSSVLLAFFASYALAESVEVRTLDQSVLVADARQVHVNLSFGNVTVEATEGDTVEIELALDCNRANFEKCKKRADRIRLAPRMSGGDLKVRLKNTPRARLRGIYARMKIRMPSHVPLEIDVKSGNVYVSGLTSHINVNSGTGDVDILGTRHTTGRVEVDAGFGKADLWLEDSRIEGSGWPRSLDWHGSGAARIDVALVGAGDVSIRLD